MSTTSHLDEISIPIWTAARLSIGAHSLPAICYSTVTTHGSLCSVRQELVQLNALAEPARWYHKSRNDILIRFCLKPRDRRASPEPLELGSTTSDLRPETVQWRTAQLQESSKDEQSPCATRKSLWSGRSSAVGVVWNHWPHFGATQCTAWGPSCLTSDRTLSG